MKILDIFFVTVTLSICYNTLFKNIRQHSLSILTDVLLKKTQPQLSSASATTSTTVIPIDYLCTVLIEVCIPLAGRRILKLQRYCNMDISITSTDQLMMEFELCIGLIFKPLRQHLPNILALTTEKSSNDHLSLVWMAVLSVLEHLFNPDNSFILSVNEIDPATSDSYHNPYRRTVMEHNGVRSDVMTDDLIATMNGLAKEHLRSAIQLMFESSSFSSPSLDETGATTTLTTQTWASLEKMGFTHEERQQWMDQLAE
jgi:hypothetical protein